MRPRGLQLYRDTGRGKYLAPMQLLREHLDHLVRLAFPASTRHCDAALLADHVPPRPLRFSTT
jgi:hypothetical protein